MHWGGADGAGHAGMQRGASASLHPGVPRAPPLPPRCIPSCLTLPVQMSLLPLPLRQTGSAVMAQGRPKAAEKKPRRAAAAERGGAKGPRKGGGGGGRNGGLGGALKGEGAQMGGVCGTGGALRGERGLNVGLGEVLRGGVELWGGGGA